MSVKRSIDRIRDSAISMQIGTPDDPSAIVEMIVIAGVMHFVKEKGIYIGSLADEIDPQRTNPAVPNAQQVVLPIGADSELVGKTLLTANKLLKPEYLPKHVDRDAGLQLALAALKDMYVMQMMIAQFEEAQEKAEVRDHRNRDRSILLPSIGDVSDRCKAFIQKADHSLQSLMGIVKLFYGDDIGRRWFESVAVYVKETYGDDDNFSKFIEEVLLPLKFVRNMRNCVEHPNSGQRIVTADFTLTPELGLVPPTIEIIHAETHQPTVLASVLMRALTTNLIDIFETMIAFLCEKNVQSFAGVQMELIILPADQRREKHVQYAYAGRIDGRLIPSL